MQNTPKKTKFISNEKEMRFVPCKTNQIIPSKLLSIDESRQKHKKNQQKKSFTSKCNQKKKETANLNISDHPKKSEKAVKESHLFDGNEIFQILVIFLRVAIIAKERK